MNFKVGDKVKVISPSKHVNQISVIVKIGHDRWDRDQIYVDLTYPKDIPQIVPKSWLTLLETKNSKLLKWIKN